MDNHRTLSNCPGLTELCKEAKRLNPLIDLSRQEACDTFQAICDDIKRRQNLTWVLATGYLDIWKKMHRIDEAFIYLEPRELVIRDALHDESCIENSTMNNREELLAKLRIAVTTLDAKAAKYLNQQAPRPASATGNSMMLGAPQPVGRIAIVNAQGKAITSTAAQKRPVCCDHVLGETQARAVIKEVRYALHQFRDDRWEKLVRVRNLLIKLNVFAAVFAYVLLEFAILAGASLETLKAATTFYLIGVVVALFKRLYDQSKSDVSLDDFRLATVRIVAAVVFSGLAAVGGVLVQMFIARDNSLGLSLSLQSIFVAAAFGLTPSLFVTAVQKQADQYKSDLKSTETSSGGTTKTTVSS
jgi:fumarate reductase subunit D